MLYRFGDCVLDTLQFHLQRAGQQVRLRPKVFQTLLYLLEHRDRVVTKQELCEHIWPTQFISDATLESTVRAVRRVTGDSRREQQVIQTLYGHGYRFVAPLARPPEVREDGIGASALPGLPTGMATAPAGLSEEPTDDTGHHAVSTAPAATDTVPPGALRFAVDSGRRQLTVMFCHLVESSHLSVHLEPEDFHNLIRAFQDMGTAMVQRYEGYVAQYLGDGVLVYFGYPLAHEDDAQRAVRAGLGMLEALGALNVRLQREYGVQLCIRLGLHTGPVVIEQTGNTGQPAQLAWGETPYLATWLQGLANADELLVSAATWELIKGYFVGKHLGSYTFQNTTRQLHVYRILRERRVESRFALSMLQGLTPLTGRGAEVRLLLERWAAVRDGQGRVVIVSGEAGIGKSRLLQVLKEHLAEESHVLLPCQCSPYHQNTAFYPLIDLMAQALEQVSADAAVGKLERLELLVQRYGLQAAEAVPLCAVLLALPVPPGRYAPLNLTPARQREKTLETLLAMLLAQASERPVLLTFEDVHWCDTATLDFLALVVAQGATAPILTVMTMRPTRELPWPLRRHSLLITLNRLSLPQTQQMVASVTKGKALPAAILEQIVRRTDGVPLFIEELTKMLLESGLLQPGTDDYELVGELAVEGIPTTLHDSLMARLDRLGEAKVVAQLGAVLGRSFTAVLLQAVAPLETMLVEDGLQQLVRAGLVYQQGVPPACTYMFKHALVQDTAYQSLLRRTRQQYHERTAAVLVAQFPHIATTQPALVAHHYTAAGRGREAMPWNMRAARQALQAVAYADALHYSEAALVAFDASLWESAYDVSADLHLLVAECRYLNADIEGFERIFATSLTRLTDTGRVMRLYEFKVIFLSSRGWHKEAVNCGLEAARRLGVDLPVQPAALATLMTTEMAMIQELMGARQPADLMDLPPLTDPDIAALIGLFIQMHPAAHNSQQFELFALMAVTNFRLNLQHGHGALAPKIYSMYAVALQALTGDKRAAAHFSQLALALDARNGHALMYVVAFVHTWFINHWVQPLSTSLAISLEAAQAAFEAGNQLSGCFNLAAYVVYLATAGAPLTDVAAVAARHFTTINQRVMVSALHVRLEWQMARALAGQTIDRCSFTDDTCNEERDLVALCRADNATQMGYYAIYKLRLHYYYEEYDRALEYAQQALAVRAAFTGTTVEFELAFFHALALLARCSEAEASAQPALIATAVAYQQQLGRWRQDCEANFAHKDLLVQAELARLANRRDEAMRLYTAAAQSAALFHFVPHAALAYELAGRYALASADRVTAQRYLTQAQSAYETWGASAKVAALQARYPWLQTPVMARQTTIPTAGSHAPTPGGLHQGV